MHTQSKTFQSMNNKEETPREVLLFLLKNSGKLEIHLLFNTSYKKS